MTDEQVLHIERLLQIFKHADPVGSVHAGEQIAIVVNQILHNGSVERRRLYNDLFLCFCVLIVVNLQRQPADTDLCIIERGYLIQIRRLRKWPVGDVGQNSGCCHDWHSLIGGQPAGMIRVIMTDKNTINRFIKTLCQLQC